MNTRTALATALSAAALLGLVGCSGSVDAASSAAPGTTSSATREAQPDPVETATATTTADPNAGATAEPNEALFSKDIMLCFDNKTDRNITWGFERSTSYVVTARQATCWPWDNSWVAPRSEFDLLFQTFDGGRGRTGTILAENPTMGWPSVSLTYDGDSSEQSGLRADARRTATLAGRQFGVNRYPDYDLTWYSSCGSGCSHRHNDSVKHLEVVFYPDTATGPDAPAAG